MVRQCLVSMYQTMTGGPNLLILILMLCILVVKPHGRCKLYISFLVLWMQVEILYSEYVGTQCSITLST
jgi:hypothetical protein